jgi:hypothetical protein
MKPETKDIKNIRVRIFWERKYSYLLKYPAESVEKKHSVCILKEWGKLAPIMSGL